MSKNLIWLNVGGEKFCTRKRLENIIWYHEKTLANCLKSIVDHALGSNSKFLFILYDLLSIQAKLKTKTP